MSQLIAFALAPAEGLVVTLDDKNKEARVKAPEEQLSLAIGRDGQNVKLASRLAGWKIEIEKREREKDNSDESKREEVKPPSKAKGGKKVEGKVNKVKKVKKVKKDEEDEK